MKKFSHIGLIANAHVTEIEDSVRHLKKFLQSRGLQLSLEAETARILSDVDLPVFDETDLDRHLDLVIVVGGDGSMLSAARMLVPHNVPVLGVNRGRLGFLTDILPDRIDQEVGRVLDGEYNISNRFLLDVTITRNDQIIGRGDALNDVVLHPGLSVRMMEFELYIDHQFVYSQRSDGLIISTPTGSTAYALAAGGPLLHPKLDAIVVVPMNPHTLTSRPIVVDSDSKIEIRVGMKQAAPGGFL